MNISEPVDRSEPASADSRSTGQTRVVAFTLIELLVVIAIIGVLAGLIVGLSGYAARKMRESRIRTELNALVTAIESYHARFGHYPKDNVVSTVPLVVNPVTNALFYELSGTVLSNTTFRTREGQEAIDAANIVTFFNMEGFVNSSTDPKQVKSFMNFKKKQYEELFLGGTPDVELLVVPVPWPLDRIDPPTGRKGLNPWRYVSTSPTNNPTTFDLWAEYVDGKRVRIICNWSKDILERQ